ncbi:MAG: hypothetical protein NTY67_10375 [Cyanobacteria bacterium]|nr:hypothetical protein [Cyanobacteriota bacterium]
MAEGKTLTAKEPNPWLDRSGLAALLAGTLIILITFFTSYSHVDIPAHDSIQVNQQIGIPLLVAALAALFGEVKLASHNRCADQGDRIEAGIRATEERNHSAEERIRAAEDRERSARRARIQARLAVAQCRFLLADSPRNRLQLSETLALLLEDLGFSK